MEKIIRYILIALVVLLLATLGIFAVRYSRDMGELRSTIGELEQRNRAIVLENNSYRIAIDAIAGTISGAQTAISGAGDGISRIRILARSIETISFELRKLPAQGTNP